MGVIHTINLPEIKYATAATMPDPNTPLNISYLCIQGSNDWLYRNFIQYDLSAIPSDAKIVSAHLKMYCFYHNSSANKGTTNISRVTQDWDKSTLTWNNQPTTEGSYLSTNVSPPAINTWTNWDITKLVKEWFEGIYPNYGLYVKNNNEYAVNVNWHAYTNSSANEKGTYIEVVYIQNANLIQLPDIKYGVAYNMPDPNAVWGSKYCAIQGSNDWLYRTFLQYDLSAIPDSAEIVSAHLKVYCRAQGNNASKGTTNISRVTQDWDKSTLTWNNQPKTTGTYLSNNVSPPAVGMWGSWDITNLVKEWHNKEYPNYGLYIKNNNEYAIGVNWDMSCHETSDGNGTYIEIIYTLNDDYYLIQDDNTIYSYLSGTLENLNTNELSSQLFLEYGMLRQKPIWEQIKDLINPKILLWRDKQEVTNNELQMTGTMIAISSDILITNAINLKDSPNITGINQVTLDSDGDILIAVSFDEKNSWLIFNDTDWNITTSNLEGMNKTTLEAITSEQWAAALGDSKTIYFKAIFSNVDDALRKINIEFLRS